MAGFVIVGVDGSDHGREALRFAVSEAGLRDASVTAVRAWSIPPLTSGGVGIFPAYHVIRDELREAAVTELARELEELRPGTPQVQLVPEVVQADPAGALIDRAEGAELLVVGSRGRGAVGAAVLGSVSQELIHHAPCPVAVVHAADRALRSRVVVGVDGSPGAEVALEWAFAEARRRSVSVHAVCACEEPWPLAAAGIAPAEAAVEYREGMAEDAERMLEAVRASASDDVEITGEIVFAPAGQALVEAAGEDLLVVGSRGRGGFKSLLLGSVSRHCASNARGVVVVVRAG